MSYPPGDGRAPSGDDGPQWGGQQPPPWGAQPTGSWSAQPAGSWGAQPAGPAPGASVCSWHPDRVTGLRCTRCGRPSCPECLTPASVGQQCRACIAEGKQGQRVARTVAGSPVGRPPLVAWILIALNVVAYIVTAVSARSFDHPEGGALFIQNSLIPLAVGNGQYWRVLTSGFLHFGVIHLAVNMMSLYFIGPTLERVLGRWRFLAVYLVSLLGGSTAVMLLSDEKVMSAGASGAIFGLLGALLVTFRKLRLDVRQLVGVLVVNLVITFAVPNISWQAHLGGLVVGAAIGAAMVLPSAARRAAVQIGAAVALVMVCAALVIWKATDVGTSGKCFYTGSGNDGPGVYCYSTSGDSS